MPFQGWTQNVSYPITLAKQMEEFVMELQNDVLKSLLTKDGPFPVEFAQQSAQPVLSVEHIHFTFLSLNGPRVVLITAYGTTNSTGWSNGRLQPYIYVQPPPDGIWDFVFVADPPSGLALDVISHISATYVWTLTGNSFQGVRVHSATNTLVEKVTKESHSPIELKKMKYRVGDKAA